jgi:hypothetical protein
MCNLVSEKSTVSVFKTEEMTSNWNAEQVTQGKPGSDTGLERNLEQTNGG